MSRYSLVFVASLSCLLFSSCRFSSVVPVQGFQPTVTVSPTASRIAQTVSTRTATITITTLSFPFKTSLRAVAPEKEKTNNNGNTVEDTTEKYGLEVGLLESMKQKDGGESAKSLLKKYGIAYLATSIPLAIISFVICYLLVDNGVDVAALLAKVGIESAASEKAGTFAIAYAAHKAASPIRFPPTVVLTPVVAKLIGKEPEEEDDKGEATRSS